MAAIQRLDRNNTYIDTMLTTSTPYGRGANLIDELSSNEKCIYF